MILPTNHEYVFQILNQKALILYFNFLQDVMQKNTFLRKTKNQLRHTFSLVKEAHSPAPNARGTTFSEKLVTPDRSPDFASETLIASNQAHVYRLSGDYNPLHIDPESARFGGFDEPILHGLCTFGHCAHLLLDGLCAGDASRFRRIKVRFSAPVFLGETLRIEAWADGEGRFQFEGRVDDRTVVSNAYFEFD